MPLVRPVLAGAESRSALNWKILFAGAAGLIKAGVSSSAYADTGQTAQGMSSDGALSPDASSEEIFEALFGRKPEPAAKLKYPIVILGQNRGDIEIQPAGHDGLAEIESDALLSLMTPMLTDARADELIEVMRGKPAITTRELTEMGYPARFDSSNLLLELDVPVEFRTVIPVPLQRRREAIVLKDAREQATTSLIANVFAGTTYVHNSASDIRGFDATQVNLDIALNHKGWVLETGARYSESASNPLTLSDTRLTYDLVEPMVRIQAGDLTVPTSGLQGNPSIGGIAGFRNFDLRPDEDFRTNPSQQFELQRPARVSVYINGQFIRELRLTSGRYDLTDLPLRTSAGNDISLEILYDTGEVERIVFSAFYDFNLLKKGVSEFAVNVGPRSEIRNSQRRYDADNIAFSGFYRKGINDRLTFGANAQFDQDLYNIGAEALYATGIGSLGIFTNFSSHDVGQGAAITGLYRLGDTDPNRQLAVDLQARFEDRHFRSLGAETSGGRFKYDVSARISGNVNDKLRLQATAGYRTRYDTGYAEQSVSVSANRRAGRGSFTAMLRYDNVLGNPEWSAGISYSIRIGDGNAQFGHETRRNATRASFGYQPGNGVDTFGYDVAYTRQSEMNELRAGVGYIGNRIDGRLEQRLAQARPGESFGSENATSLFLGSAFVYADGQMALSRPVTDSFAMFTPHEGANMFNLAIDPSFSVFSSARSYSAKSSLFGPAVLPDLQSYYPRTVQVEAPDAPAGISIGTETFAFRPGFRSGYMVKVGTDRNVSVIGMLLDEQGNTVPFASGYIILPDGQRKPTFSNGGGRFFVDGLKGGEQLRIEFDTPAGMVADIVVPEGAIGVARLKQGVVMRRKGPDRSQIIASLRANGEAR